MCVRVSRQQQTREASGEWFGKKGICWHGAIITLPAALCGGEKQEFITVHDVLFSETKQDALTVLSIIESLFVFIKRRWPGITEAVLQTDNAACYVSTLLIGTPRRSAPARTATRCRCGGGATACPRSLAP